MPVAREEIRLPFLATGNKQLVALVLPLALVAQISHRRGAEDAEKRMKYMGKNEFASYLIMLRCVAERVVDISLIHYFLCVLCAFAVNLAF